MEGKSASDDKHSYRLSTKRSSVANYLEHLNIIGNLSGLKVSYSSV